MSLLEKYVVTVSVCSPEDTDTREQLSYRCRSETLTQTPVILQTLIREVVEKLDIRIAREAVEATTLPEKTGEITEQEQTGDYEWFKALPSEVA